jgi:hypothetical protein
MPYSDEKKKAIIDEKSPRAARYDPEWQLENEMGSQQSCLGWGKPPPSQVK